MESMMAYCASPKFEDTVEDVSSFLLSSSFIDNFEMSVSATPSYELYGNDDDEADTSNEGTPNGDLVRELQQEVENNRMQIKRLEDDVAFYRGHIENIEEEHKQLLKDLAEAEKNVQKKDKKLDHLNATVCTLKNELESFYNADTTANETASSSGELHGTISFSSDSANNLVSLQIMCYQCLTVIFYQTADEHF